MRTPPLKLLQIDLTDECPLYCAHCSNSSGPSRNAHFPFQRLLDIVSEAKGLGLERVVYSGGEPLRYPYLEEALSFAKVNCIPATIFTTGIFDKATRLPVSAEAWRRLAREGLVAAGFSIYAGPSHRGYHNAVVRTRPAIGDAFGVNEQAIRGARSAGIAVELHFIPSGASIADLPEMYSWAVRLGCSVLHLQIPTYQGRNSDKAFLELNSADEGRLKKAASALIPIPGQTGFYISRFWRSRWNISADSNCVANLEQLVVRTDGTISPCNAYKYGSVTLEPENLLAAGATLANLWRHSRILQELRHTHGKRALPLNRGEFLASIPEVEALQG